MPGNRNWDNHLGERLNRIALLLRIGLPAWLALTFVHIKLSTNGRLSDTAMYIWLAADPFLAVGIALGVGVLIERTSRGFASMVLAGGNIPYSHQYSEQDALIAQGRIDDAIASFQALIAVNPRDLEARLRLAALLAGPAGRREDAEREFLEVRTLAPSPQQTAVLSNALIDLYRDMGRREDLMIELGRFARRFPDSRSGQAAGAYLARLRADDSSASADP